MMADLEKCIKDWVDAAAVGVAPVSLDDVRVKAQRRSRHKGGLAAAAVLVVAVAAVVALGNARQDTTLVTDKTPRRRPSTTVRAMNEDDYDTVALLADLGPDARSITLATASGPPTFLDTTPAAICFSNHVLRVYEYPSAAARAALSDRISRDGSQVPAGPGIAIAEWIGPPHFYVRGRIIVLYLGPQDETAVELDTVLGRTISPDGVVGRGRGVKPETC